MLDKNGIGDCEIGSCGNTFPGNTTGIAPAGRIAQGVGLAVAAMFAPEVTAAVVRGGLTIRAIVGRRANAVAIRVASDIKASSYSDFADSFQTYFKGLDTTRNLNLVARVQTAFVLAAADHPEYRAMVANMIRTVFRRGG